MLCCVTKKIEKEKIKNWSEEGPELARDERRKAEKEEERTGEGARPWSRLAQGTTWGPHGDHRGPQGANGTHSEPPGEDMPSPAPTQSERQDFCQPGVPHGDLWSAVTGAPVAWTQAKMHLALYRQPHGAQGPFGEALDTTWCLGHYDTLHLLCLRAAGSSPSPSAQTHQSWDSNSTLPDLV